MKSLLLLRDLLVAAVVIALAAPLWLLPWRAALRLGRLLGLVAYHLWPRARRVGMINLRRAYGAEMTREKARLAVREVVANLFQGAAEAAQFARRFKGDGAAWETLYTAEDPALEARLLADPRPKIFVTGHLGSWEIGAMMVGQRIGDRGAAVVRRVENPFLNAVVKSVRVTHATQWIDKQGSVGTALDLLRAGQSVLLLLDENGGHRGHFVSFFGRPASTQKTAALLSLKTGAPIVLGAAVRRGDRLFYRLSLIEVPEERRPESLRPLTQEIVARFEAWVREDPLQWRWIHHRWKTRPDGTEETYGREDVARCFA